MQDNNEYKQALKGRQHEKFFIIPNFNFLRLSAVNEAGDFLFGVKLYLEGA